MSTWYDELRQTYRPERVRLCSSPSHRRIRAVAPFASFTRPNSRLTTCTAPSLSRSMAKSRRSTSATSQRCWIACDATVSGWSTRSTSP